MQELSNIKAEVNPTEESLQEQLQYYKKGEKVTLTLQIPGEGGEYQEQTVDVTLGRKAQ